MDCGYDSEDEVSGFLNNVVDQSISDLMEEDEKNPQIDFGAQKPNINQEFSKTKSLPSLETNVDSQKHTLAKTPSQPGINRRPTKVVMDNKDLRRNLLQRQYKQAVIDQRANKAPGIREEPDKPRKATAADLRLDPSSTSDQKPGQASPATDTETTDPSSSEKAEQDTEEDMDKNIDDFVNISLSSITKEEMLDEHVDDFVSSSLMRIVGDDTAMVLMKDNEKEMHQDVRSEDHKLGTIDIVGEAKKEIEQFHTDKDGHSTPTADINEKKVNDIEAKDLDLAENIDSVVPETKASTRSVFGFFIRRRSTGSLKLRYPCLQLVCGNSKVEESDNFAENKNTSRTKKPGFLRRLFSCLRREGGRVDPRNDE